MTEIIGVRFKSAGKVYYFSPGRLKIDAESIVIVETARGIECGEVVFANRMVDDKSITVPLKTIIRTANEHDMKIIEQNKQKEENALKVCQEKIIEHNLDMKLVDVECTFDNNKLLFYFTAETRIDFRELVKDLAAVFRTRIELRQIGVRDEAKVLGGLGICGKEFCCKGFLGEFQPVSIKMAKEQGLSLNPTKISGTCGRLMCCLKYEQDVYEELIKTSPRVGAYVKTAEFNGFVEDINLLTGMLKVKQEKSDTPAVWVKKDDVTVIRDGKIKLDRDEIKALKALEGR